MNLGCQKKNSIWIMYMGIISSKTTVFLLRSSSSVPSELLHAPGSAYIFWNNGRILMFKVSKRLSWSVISSKNEGMTAIFMIFYCFFLFHGLDFVLSISSEIMDGFWCSRCLYNHIDAPDMMGSFSGGATTPLVVKIWTKQPRVKIENSRNFDCNFALSRGKIWLRLFYDFFALWF